MKFDKISPAYLIQSIGKAAKFLEVNKRTRLLATFSLVIFIFWAAAKLSLSAEVDYLTQMGVVRLKKMPDAPDFNLSDLEGSKRSLGDFKDKFVMLNFWATW